MEFLQFPEENLDAKSPHSAADLLADLVGCCEGGPADLSINASYLTDFGAS
jgi:hypothetical protein